MTHQENLAARTARSAARREEHRANSHARKAQALAMLEVLRRDVAAFDADSLNGHLGLCRLLEQLADAGMSRNLVGDCNEEDVARDNFAADVERVLDEGAA